MTGCGFFATTMMLGRGASKQGKSLLGGGT